MRLPWWEKSLSGCDKVQCNVLLISILYNIEIGVFECSFSCFLPDYDAVFHARIIAKMDCPFLLFHPILGRVTRPMNPISLPSTPQNSTSAPLFRCPEPRFLIPQTTTWDVPFCHLGYFKACLCPHIGAVLPSLCADFFPL